MARLLFEKMGNAIWISHLDLMRLFQRAFQRAGLHLKHSQGFNPRPMVSIALPMSVGVESCCELLDFDLEDQSALSHEEICAKLNATLVSGVKVLSVYEPARKVKEISRMRCRVQLEYDNGIDPVGLQAIKDIFNQEQLLVEKKGKNGPSQQDIIPLLSELQVACHDGHVVMLDAVVCAQNPALNPMLLASAVERYLPNMRPNFSKCKRIEVYDFNGNVFR
jgi:radical SAM-linked protein